jgi:hypothetical protein
VFVVTGATGNTGSVVADTLLQQGKPVTVFLRDNAKSDEWKSKGAQVAVADLADPAAFAAALQGAEAAYIMVPPLYGTNTFLADMAKLADAMARGIKQSGIPYIVMLSSVGAQHPEGIAAGEAGQVERRRRLLVELAAAAGAVAAAGQLHAREVLRAHPEKPGHRVQDHQELRRGTAGLRRDDDQVRGPGTGDVLERDAFL